MLLQQTLRVAIDRIVTKELKAITELDSKERIFKGILSAETVDKQNEIVIVDELEKVLPLWMSRGAPITDTHSNRVVGRGLNYQRKDMILENGEVVPAIEITGMIFRNYELDDVIWKAIINQDYKGLSFGGATKGARIPVSLGDGRFAYKLADLEQYEVAVCREPANPLAIITDYNRLAKAIPEQPFIDMNKQSINKAEVRVVCKSMTCYVEKANPITLDYDMAMKALGVVLKPNDKRPPKKWWNGCMSATGDKAALCGWVFYHKLGGSKDQAEQNADKPDFGAKKNFEEEQNDKKKKPSEKDEKESKPKAPTKKPSDASTDVENMDHTMDEDYMPEDQTENDLQTDSAIPEAELQTEPAGYEQADQNFMQAEADKLEQEGGANEKDTNMKIETTPSQAINITIPEVAPEDIYSDDLEFDPALLDGINQEATNYLNGDMQAEKPTANVAESPFEKKPEEDEKENEQTVNFNNEDMTASDSDMSAPQKTDSKPDKAAERKEANKADTGFDMEQFLEKVSSKVADTVNKTIDEKLVSFEDSFAKKVDEKIKQAIPTKKENQVGGGAGGKEVSANSETQLDNLSEKEEDVDESKSATDKLQLGEKAFIHKNVTPRPRQAPTDIGQRSAGVDKNAPNPIMKALLGGESPSVVAAKIHSKEMLETMRSEVNMGGDL